MRPHESSRTWVATPTHQAARAVFMGTCVLLAVVCIEARQATPVSSSAASSTQNWTMEQLLPAVTDLGKGRDWLQGGRVFEQAGCGMCHAFSTYWQGNGLAPDLTAVGSKYTRDVILQSILEPSATLNGQYFHTEFTLKDGTVIRGTVMDVVNKRLIVAPVMMAPDVTVAVAESDVKSERPSPVSPMPPALLNPFSKNQILDLLAFLDAGGNPDADVFKKP